MLETLANFVAGVGASLTFGATDWIRAHTRGGDEVVDQHSGAYVAGELTEVVAEIAVTAGSAALKHAAAGVTAREARAAARPFVEGVERAAGEQVHHINPLAGHPGGGSTMLPLRGLPAAIHSGSWNLKALSVADHTAAHVRLQTLETVAGVVLHPGATAGRGVGDYLRGDQ